MGLDLTHPRSTELGPAAPVPILQREWEFDTLLHIYADKKPKRVLEIGTYHGGTLFHWLSTHAPDVVVAVDSYQTGVDNRHLFAEWAAEHESMLVIVQGDSMHPDTVAAVAEHAPFDWVWIDAGHYEHEAQADWNNYGSLCAPGGIVCLHDILTHPSHPAIEVEPVWRRIQQSGYLTRELVADPHAEWGGIGVVYL